MNLKRMVFIALGCICLGLGCIGIVLPILPTVPFFLATVFFFANSSQHLHNWFIGTNLYKKHLESYVQKRGMLIKTKLTIVGSVTLLMSIGFLLMLQKALYIPCAILAFVWIGHIVYFFFGVKTIRAEDLCMSDTDSLPVA